MRSPVALPTRAVREREVHVALQRTDGRDGVSSAVPMLAAVLGVEPGEVVVARGPNGKPSIAIPQTDLRFGVAHTPEVTVVALARGVDVGVDIEPLDRDVDGWALLRQALTPAEQRRLDGVGRTGRREGFLRLWVQKEAILKAAGCGLSIDPRAVELAADGTLVNVPAQLGRPASWSVRDLLVPGFAVAVAAHGPVDAVHVDTFPVSSQRGLM